MGEDTLPDFHKWKNWRKLAATMPIAVLSRPGYDDDARAARAMAALAGKTTVSMETLKSVAPLALRHRLRTDPLDDTDASVRVERAVAEVFAA